MLPPVAADSCASLMLSSQYSDTTIFRLRWNDRGQRHADSLQPSFDECDTSNNSESITVYPPQPSVNLEFIPPSCYGASNGRAFASQTADLLEPLSWYWSNGNQSDTLVAPSGVYQLTVRDGRQCEAQASVTVTQPPPLRVLASHEPVGCREGQWGSIIGSAQGGTPGYRYALNDGDWQNTGVYSSLDTGSYTLKVRDANGCQTDTLIQIQTNGTRVYTTIHGPSLLCQDSGWVSLNAEPAGGVWGPDSIIESNGNIYTLELDTGLTTVWYGVAGACGDTSFHTLQIAPRANAGFTLKSPLCSNDTAEFADAATAGGTWSGMGIDNSGWFSPRLAGEGLHTISYKLGGTCPAEHSQQVEVAPVPHIAMHVPDSACALNTVPLSASPPGGIWSGPGFPGNPNSWSPESAGAGEHVLYYEYLGLCPAIDSAVITVYPPIAPQFEVWDSLCYGFSDTLLTAQPTGGTWWGTGVDAQGWLRSTNLESGSYWLYYHPAMACAVTDSQQIHVAAPLQLPAVTDSVPCAGDVLPVLASPVSGGVSPYQYQWSHDATLQGNTAFNLSPGTYQLRVIDQLGCTKNTTHQVLEPDSLTASVVSTQHIRCFNICDGAVTWEALGGWSNPINYQYQLNGVAIPATSMHLQDLCSGNYQLRIRDSLGCETQLTWVLTEPEKLGASTQTDTAYCDLENGGIQIEEITGGQAPYAFRWNNQNWDTPLQSADSGVYNLTIRDQNACTLDTAFHIPHATGVSASLASTDLRCYQDATGRIRVQGQGKYPPFWLNDTLEITNAQFNLVLPNLPASNYTIRLSDAQQCTWEGQTHLAQPEPLEILPVVPQTLCSQDTLLLWYEAQGGSAPYRFYKGGYPITLPDTVVNESIRNIYAVDAQGCRSTTVPVGMRYLDPLLLQAPDTLHGCPDSLFQLSATATGGSGAYKWLWQDSIPQQQYSFRMKAEDENLVVQVVDLICRDTSQKNIPAYPYSTPLVNITISDAQGCEPHTVQFEVEQSSELTHWHWELGDGHRHSDRVKVMHTYTRSGSYVPRVIGHSTLGCRFKSAAQDTIWVHPVPRVQLQASPVRLTTLQSSTQIKVYSIPTLEQGLHWDVWSTVGDTLLSTDTNLNLWRLDLPEKAAEYYVKVKGETAAGCPGNAQIMLVVDQAWEIYAPNSFTPNSDGLNEGFRFYASNLPEGSVQWSIFNRWGEQIFRSQDLNEAWPGTYRGEPVQNGVYVWKLRIQHPEGNADYTGKVTVLR